MLALTIWLYDKGAMGFEGILTCTIAMMGSFGPVVALSSLSNNLNQTLASGERVLSLLEETPLVEEIPGDVETSGAESMEHEFTGAEAEHVTFAYDNEVILDNYSLKMQTGKITGIHGASGSGKSTLAKQLAALLKPSGGIIYVGGMDTAKEEQILDIRKTAGLVFQNPDNQLIGNIVEEDVAFGPENMGIPAEEIEMRITKALASTGMTAYREASPGALSGGQKQKIAISGVLAMEPECIIFDEPTAMIDPESRKELLEAIYDLKRLKNITVIYITHFLQEVSQADYLYVMNHGKITLKGTPETLFKIPEKLVENNLELPFEVALIDGLRKKSVDVPEEIYTKQQLLEFLKYHFQKDKSDNIVLSEYKSERKTISESS